ncbi:MAG: WG repeat-containing protein [Gallionella sp.]|nr:WG repeat-containing protein [Gallionella sp.]
MNRAQGIALTVNLSMLGLLGVALLLEGVWFAWQGGPIGGVLMMLATGGLLAGCAIWLLFFSPELAVTDEPALNPPAHSIPETPTDNPAPVQVHTWHQRLKDDTPLWLAAPDEVRAALAGIGMNRINGASWQEAVADARWAHLSVFLHCERDKLDSSPDDVDGLYFTREAADAAVAASPQLANYYTWKVFVSTTALQYIIEDRRALPHLVRAIKKELFARPSCPGTRVGLKGWNSGEAWLDTSGQRVVLFEDENVLDGYFTASGDLRTAAFKTDTGMGRFDENGEIVLPPRFEEVDGFHGGRAVAKLNGRWGFVDVHDHWQIEPRFLELSRLVWDDYARARTAQGWGIIDRQARWLVADRYAEIGEVSLLKRGTGIAAIRKQDCDLWGIIEFGYRDGPAFFDEAESEWLSSGQNEKTVIDFVCTTEEEAVETYWSLVDAQSEKPGET